MKCHQRKSHSCRASPDQENFPGPSCSPPTLHGLGTLWAARRDNPVYGSRITVCLTGCCCMFISHFLGSLTTPGTPPGPLCFLCCQRWHKTQIRAWMGPCSAQGCGWFCDQGNLNIYLRAKLNNLLFSNRRRRREVGTEPMMIFLSMLPGNFCLNENMWCTWYPAVCCCRVMFLFIFFTLRMGECSICPNLG